MNKRGAKKVLDSILILALIASMLYFVIGDTYLNYNNLATPANNTVFTNTSNNNISLTCAVGGNSTAGNATGNSSTPPGIIANLSLFITNSSSLLNNPSAAINRTWRLNQTNASAVANSTNYSFFVNLSSTGLDDGNWTWNCFGVSLNVSYGGVNGTGNFSDGNRTFIVDTLTPSITLNISNGSALNGTAAGGTNGRNGTSLNCTASTQSTYSIRNVTLWMNGTSGGSNATWKTITSNQTALTNATTVNFALNNTQEGTYTWTCDVYDSSPGNNLSVAANRTVIVDATVPTNITINSPVNNTNLSTGTLNLNWSAVENVYTYTTCSVTVDGTVNGTGIVVQNGTSNNGSRQITGLSNADHTVNVTCADGNGNSNTSATFKISVDAGGPTLSISPSSNTALSLGQSQSVSCSSSSVTSITSLSLSVAGTNVCTGLNSCSGTYVAGTSGDKTMTCTSTNSAGVSASSSITFTVSTDSGTPTGPTGDGGPGGSPPETTTTITTTGQIADVSTFGTTTSLGTNENVNVVVDGTQSTLTVTSVGVSSATAQIAGETVTLYVGQSQSVDLNDDGTDDIKLSLTSIKDGEANFEIKKSEARVTTEAGPAEAVAPVSAGEKQAAKPKVSLWMLLGLIVIIVIVGVVFYFTQRGKVGSNKKYRP